MAVKILNSAAVTAFLFTAAVAAMPAAAQQTKALASDSVFIQTAASTGLLQVKLGKLAEKKGSSDAVKDFGRRMVADYTKANESLASAAKQAAFPSPTLLRQDKELFNRFQGMGGSSFDKNYMSEMVKQHSEEVRLFREEAENGKVKSLKELASSMLPELQQRLTVATETAGSIGVQVTASAGDASRRSTGR